MNQNQTMTVAQALRIVEMVQSLPIGGKAEDMPTPFHAGFQLACEEVVARIVATAEAKVR